MSTCRWVSEEAGRVVDDAHHKECNLSGCPGCKPCVPEYGHCTSCGHRHLADGERWVCARCVGKVRTKISKILAYSAQAHREVVQRGIGSTAFLVAAPAADPEAFGYVKQSAVAGRLCKCHLRRQVCPATVQWRGVPFVHPPHRICPDAAFVLEDARDELHPLTVLGWWEILWREHLGHVSGRVTVGSAYSYLTEHLTRMAQQLEPDFEQFTSEVAECCAWLEGLLGEGVREERGAECFMCGKARVVKWYDDELVTLDDGTVTGAQDHWFCPREECGHWWTEEDYRTKVDGIYVQKADRLTASQIAQAYRVPEGSVRGWASKGLVRRRGHNQHGLVLYDVADALVMRDRKTVGRVS